MLPCATPPLSAKRQEEFVMKRIFTCFLTLLLLVPLNVFGEDDSRVFINFEDGIGNMLLINGEAYKDENNNNSLLALRSLNEQAYMQKSFRNMRGSIVGGFKLIIDSNEADVGFCFVCDNGKLNNIISFKDGNVICADKILCEYIENEEIKVFILVNTDEEKCFFNINGKNTEKFEINGLKPGVTGFVFKAFSENQSNVMIDNICCYYGNAIISEYDMMSTKQKAIANTKKTALYAEHEKSAILNSRVINDTNGLVMADEAVYLPLRSTVEAVGGKVDWNDGVTTVTYNDVKYVLKADSNSIEVNGVTKITDKTIKLINSSMYLPFSSYSAVLGLNTHTDIGGIYMVSSDNSFVKSTEQPEFYSVLVGELTGDNYIINADKSYRIIPSDFENFHMDKILVSSVSASSEPQATEGYIKENVLDGDLSTRWSSDENGAELIIDLGSKQDISGIYLAFYNGTVRKAQLEIYTSNDGKTWDLTLGRTESSGLTDMCEIYPLNASARFIKYKGYGTTAGVWNSVTEFGALKER